MTDYLQGTQQLKSVLEQLNGDEIPQFGMMSAQHMIEHLVFAIQFSNGKNPQECKYPEALAHRFRSRIIGTNNEFKPGLKAPILPKDQLISLWFENIPTATHHLISELEDFKNYSTQNPQDKPMHPAFGAMNWEEWTEFHNKHIRHHLRQFNLKND